MIKIGQSQYGLPSKKQALCKVIHRINCAKCWFYIDNKLSEKKKDKKQEKCYTAQM